MFAFVMKVNSFFLLFFVIITAIILVFAGGGCASIVPPSGGPRDSLAPIIAEVDPPSGTVHFNKNKITITFDEYIDLNDVYKNLVVSPLPKIFPDVARKLKTVTIKIKDTLEENTTYVYNFTNVIKDINEGNKAKDLLYVVSTGSYFDSLQLSGNVKIAKTAKPDSTLTVMLYTSADDSAVIKERPRYIAKVDSSGNFLFRYLSPGTYHLYALKDEGGSYLYTSKQQIFAFADSAVVINNIPPVPIRMYAYAEEEPEKGDATETPELNKKEKRIKFQLNLQGDQQDLLEPLIFTFESPLKTFDTTKIAFSTDSTFTPVTGNNYIIDSTQRIVTMKMPWKEGTRYNLILQKDFATDSLNRGLLKMDTLKFTTKSQKDYGQAKLTFNNLDLSVNPVLLILQNGTVKNTFPLTSNILEINLYNPGDYELQILYDKNKNGKWDPGSFFGKHVQPEIIVPLDRKLNFKANWLIEPEINLRKPQ